MHICTGFRLVDCLFPVALGQRELIIGDRQTGKSTLALYTIINQLSINMEVSFRKTLFGVIVCVAQKCSIVMRLYELLVRSISIEYIVIVFVSIVESMSLQFISPLSGSSIAEYFRNQGFNCMIVYDDLSKHAVSYRQLSLALRKPVGREAFPSDIFYLHARLLERSCCLNPRFSCGSLACLPIIETLNNDLSAYVATNIISITDGQLYLDCILFGHGIYPAISIEKSVSRVGAKSLDGFWRGLSFRLYTMMNEYKQELESVVKSSLFKIRKHRWERIYSIFQQRGVSYHYYNALLLVLMVHGFGDLVDIKLVKLFEYCIINSDLNILIDLVLDPYYFSSID
jgi:proton translocating ATP synthase F1 alpha subunit